MTDKIIKFSSINNHSIELKIFFEYRDMKLLRNFLLSHNGLQIRNHR